MISGSRLRKGLRPPRPRSAEDEPSAGSSVSEGVKVVVAPVPPRLSPPSRRWSQPQRSHRPDSPGVHVVAAAAAPRPRTSRCRRGPVPGRRRCRCRCHCRCQRWSTRAPLHRRRRRRSRSSSPSVEPSFWNRPRGCRFLGLRSFTGAAARRRRHCRRRRRRHAGRC